MTHKVSVILPILIKEDWQEVMTEACIKTMKCTTNIPYELIIVESGSDTFKRLAHKHIMIKEESTYTKDFNKGANNASGDILIQIANDIFTKPGWLEAILACFKIPDCSAATLASSDLKHQSINRIMEGMWGPLMAFPSTFRFDEQFENIFSDADLVMRIYETGQRMYRNWNVVVTHLYQQTYSGEYNSKEKMDAQFNKGKQLFIEKHKDSNLLMYRVLSEGWVI